MEELERRCRIEQCRELSPWCGEEVEGANATITEHGESCSNALATGKIRACLVEQRLGVWPEHLELGSMVRDHIIDPLLNKPCESGGFLHVASLARSGGVDC